MPVDLVGGVPQSALVAHFRTADVYVNLSEHEGFCVPLLEAMWHGVPTIAYRVAAVPETVGDPPAGLLLDDKSPVTVAASVHRVLTDGELAQALVAARPPSGQGLLDCQDAGPLPRGDRGTRRLKAIHQFVPTFEPGAVGAHTIELQRLVGRPRPGIGDLRRVHKAPIPRSSPPLPGIRPPLPGFGRRRLAVPNGHRLERGRLRRPARRAARHQPSQCDPGLVHRAMGSGGQLRDVVGRVSAARPGREAGWPATRVGLQRT